MKGTRMIYIVVFLFASMIWLSGVVNADDVVVDLPSTDGSDAFQVKDLGGTSLMSVWSDGNVGIGTTAPPSVKLQVQDGWINSVSGNNILSFRGKQAGSIYGFTDPSIIVAHGSSLQSLAIGTAGASDVAFVTNGTQRLRIEANTGSVGIGTTSPGVKLTLSGTDVNYPAGPHLEVYTSLDSFPVFQQLNWEHDNINLSFDSYWNGGTWKSSDVGSNFQIQKYADKLIMKYDSGITQGNDIIWNDGFVMDTIGNVGIGTTSPTGILHVEGGEAASGDGTDITLNAEDGFSGGDNHGGDILLLPGAGFGLDGDTGNVGINTSNPTTRLSVNGSLLVFNGNAWKPGGGSWLDSSDRRLKKNVNTIEDALEKVSQLRGVNFEWINPDEHSVTGLAQGFIAQEVEEVFPEFISEVNSQGKDKGLTSDGKAKCMALPFAFDAYLVEAIKALKSENDVVKAENKKLSEELLAMKARQDAIEAVVFAGANNEDERLAKLDDKLKTVK